MQVLQRNLWVVVSDFHFRQHNKKTWRTILQFVRANRKRIAGFVFLGDQLDFETISPHTSEKRGLRRQGGLKADLDGFRSEVLDPLDAILLPETKKVYELGNHDSWCNQLYETLPELAGMLDHTKYLKLEESGWKIIPQGDFYRLGHLALFHGDTLAQGLNAAKKALEIVGGNVLMGHTHAPASASKVSPVRSRRAMAWVAPVVADCNPRYGRNKSNAWINGMVVIEMHPNNQDFSLFPCIFTDNKFVYGGTLYDGH
jgi:hypothetical protein